MTEQDILSVPIEQPGLLFNNPNDIKAEYKTLAMKWHPDHGHPDEIFAHITEVYKYALEQADTGFWDSANEVHMKNVDGRKFTFHYKFKHPFELGMYYVGDRNLMYAVDKTHNNLIDVAIQSMKPVFPTAEMGKELGRFLPKLNRVVELKDKRIIVLEKTPDVVPLRWVMEHFKKVPPKQAAWMMSSILNICCGLQVAGSVHNDISLDTLYVSIKHHSGLLLGGWWYSGKIGSKMTQLPARTYNMLPKLVINAKEHAIKSMLTTAKATIAETLGASSGPALRSDKDIPAPFVDWLLSPSGVDAITAYQQWKTKVLPAMKYKKEFILWDVPQEELLS